MFAEDSADWNIDLSGSVLCEVCGEEPATIHLLRVVDGAVGHTHLCPGCAEDVAEQTDGLALVLAVPSVFRNLSRSVLELGRRLGMDHLSCWDLLDCVAAFVALRRNGIT